MPKRSATSRACGSSLYSSWVKPIENVRTGSDDCSAIAATTVEESTPPDRNAPRGTSAIIRRPTARLIWLRISSLRSAALANRRLAEKSNRQ